MISFLAAGFNRVDVTRLERSELEKNQKAVITAAIARRLAGLFESATGPALRFFMPLLLLAIVYIPLRSALDEVAWQVRVRAAVQKALGQEPNKIVQSRVRVERHEVELRVVLLGSTEDAQAARGRLHAQVEDAAGVVPRIEVIAIPDATSFAGLESTVRAGQDPLPVVAAPPPPTPREQLANARVLVKSSVSRAWPSATAGRPLAIEVGTATSGPLPIRVIHLGPALGADALESLNRSLEASLGQEVEIADVAIPADVLTRTDGDIQFLSRMAAGIRASAALPDIHVCAVEPTWPARRRIPPRDREFAEAARALLAEHPRVSLTRGEAWAVQLIAAPPAGAGSAVHRDPPCPKAPGPSVRHRP